MADETNIQPIQPDFERIRQTAEDVQDYWSPRELATTLGYSTWPTCETFLKREKPWSSSLRA